MKIELVEYKDKSITITNIVDALNNRLGAIEKGFFYLDEDQESIAFQDCANMDKHNKLIALVALFISSNKNLGYQSLSGRGERGKAGHFNISKELIPELLRFIESIDLTKEVQITY